MADCYCSSMKPLSECCGPFLDGDKSPDTAEALMRSRYSAYATGNIDYLESTLLPSEREDHDKKSAKEWSDMATWKGLEIKRIEKGGPKDKVGEVEFVARFEVEGDDLTHHEISDFIKLEDGKWYFKSGRVVGVPIRRESPKVGRNDPCYCGSGKKFKKCHGK